MSEQTLMSNPAVRLLDEPFEGVAPSVVEGVVAALAELRGRTTMLLVEQNADLALGLADRSYVVNNGSVSWTGVASGLRDDTEFRGRLLGV